MNLKILDLLICEEKVYEASIITDTVRHFSPISDLACKDVLWSEIVLDASEISFIKPRRIVFNRVAFNENSTYEFDYSHFFRTLYNCHLFLELTSIKENKKVKKIPYGPIIPTDHEYSLLVQYLDEQYPTLLDRYPDFISYAIYEVKQKHEELVALVRNTSKFAH